MAKENADNIDAASTDTASGEEIQVQLIDGVCVVTTNDISSTLSSPIVIEKPAAGQTTEIDVVGGQKYLFDFSENNVESFVQEGDDLTLSFADGSSILLAGFGTAAASAIPTSLAFTGDMTAEELRQLIRVVSNEPQSEELDAVEDEPQSEVRGEEQADAGDTTGGEDDSGAQQVAAVEPAAGEEINPEELAQIEPAAGEGNTGGGAADAGGAGFQSSFTPQGVLGLEDVGPIGPTALQYRIPEFKEDIFVEEQEVDDIPQILSPDALDLDETNLGPLSQTGNVNVDFGNDGPGTITPDGSFSSGGSQTGGTLSSNGNLIDVTPTADGYVGTINGGADTVFEITINPNTGEFEFTQFLAIDHDDGTNPDDVITLNFGVVATDADGDAANAEIVVNIADDAPATAAPDSNTINETALSGGPIVVNDALVVDFGNDGPGAVAQNGVTNVTGVTNLTSSGVAITITPTATGYVGTLAGGGTAFELTIDPATGSYVYTQYVAIDHDVVTDTISLDFGVNVTDFDTDSTATTITINIIDSVPEIKNDKPTVGNGLENVDETNLPAGSTASGSLNVDFGADVPGQIVPDGNTDVTGSLAGGALTSNGNAITITQTADGYVGTINGGADTVFTFTIDPTNGDYTFTQNLAIDHDDGTNANDIITIEFGVVVEDADGDSDSGSVIINIADDGPSVVDPAAENINEKDIATAPVTVNGTVAPDFGSDGAGDVQPDGVNSFSGVTNLTSNGDAITVTQTADGYVGTLPGGATAFVLTVNPATGEYSFTQNVALDHDAGSNTITLNFGVVATDFDTDTASTTISINIKDSVPEINDKPKLGDGLEVVDETDLPGVTTSGQLTVDFGSDLPGAVTANDTFTSGGSQLGGNLTSNGVPVDVNLVGDTYVGTAGTDTIFTLQVNADGSYTFELLGTLDHADPNDPNDIIDLNFGVVATDGDGDEAATTIIIKVKDDVPVIGDAAGDVDESNLDGGPLSTSDTIFTSFGTEVGSIAPNGTVSSEAGGVPIALTSNGNAITITQTADGYVGTVNGGADTIFTITVDSQTGQYTYTQFDTLDHPDGTDSNDTIELSFGVAVTSTDGDSDSGTITISVGDDGPIANDDVSGAEEGQVITGNLVVNDDLSQDVENTVTNVNHNGTDYPIAPGGSVDITTALGSITINSDGTYTYIATDIGDPDGTDVFTYTLTDGDTDNDTATLSIRVTPDGEPVAVTEVMTVDETNLQPGPLVINESIALDFGLDGAGTFDPNGDFQFGGSALNGNLTSGGVPVLVTETANGYVGTIQGTTDVVFELIVQDNGDYSFQLFNTLDHDDATDPNDTIVLDFGVTLTDSDGDTADGTITINVLDDAPVAFDDSNTVLENQLTASGNVTNNDIDGEDSPSVVTSIAFNGADVPVVAGVATIINGQYGQLSINSDGTYTYTSNGTNTTAVQDVFTYALTDFDGDTDTAELTINITDIDVKPELSGSAVTVDETDLNPTDDASNSVTANFGVDGPGTYALVGLDSFNGAENNQLTSNGLPVNVGNEGGDLVGRANGEEIFRLTLNENTGEYTFTLVGTLDHGDETDHDDIIQLLFDVSATDSDGDTDTGTITVNVKDDGPYINTKAAAIDEDGLATNASISYTRTLNHDYGEDGQGEINPDGTFMALFQMGGNAQTLTSDGEEVFVTQTADGYIGQTAGGDVIFTVSVQNNGQYTYTQFAGLDHPDPTDPDDVIWLKFGVEIVDFDGDTDQAFIQVDVHDAMPTAPNNSVFPVAEHSLDNGPVVVTKNFNGGDFGGDGEGQYEFNGTFMLLGNSSTQTGELTSGGEKIDVTFNGNVATGELADGTVVFTMEIDPATGQHTFTLFEPVDHGKPDASGAQDVAWIKFGVDIVDADGDSKPATIQVDIRDDAPSANDDCNEFSVEATNQDFNIVMALDVSGSMSGDKLALLKSSVANLLTDFGGYNGGEIKVHLVPFATDAGAGATFTVTDQAGFDAAIAYINGLSANGTTNYEAPLQSAIDWLNGATADDPIAGGETYTYFVSDGEPNRYLDTNGQIAAGNANEVMGEVTGSDGSNEVAILQGLSTEVIGVGIGVNGTTLARLGQIDSDGNALDVQDPTDLDAMLQGTNPVTGQTSGNVITGLNGGAGAADNLSQDVDNTVTKIAFNGNVVDVDPVNGATIDGAYGKLTINADGSYTYKITAQNITANILEEFTYTLVDGDGDVSTAALLLKGTYTHDDQPDLATSNVTVDETNLNPTDDASNTITADFGADGPGAYTVTGAGTFGFSGATNNQLTSNGVDVDVTVEGNDYVGKAGGDEIFRLALNETTGEYEFTLSGVLDHADTTNPDDIIELTFGVTATDGDGDTDTGSIVVNVKDDGPSINSKASAIDEDGLATNASISYTRTLTHDYGEDGAGEIRPTDTFMATYSMGGNAQTITSDGVTVDIQATANGYVGKANGQTVFTLEVQANGQYTYTQYAGLDHPDTNNDDDVMWLKFGVEIVDFDGDTAPATITVDVHDAAPTAPNNSVFPVAEHGLENGPVVVMKNFNGGDFGGDGEGQYEYNGTFMLLGNSSTATDELTSGGEKVDVTFNGNVATGTTTGGTVVFTMALDPATGKHTFTLFEPLDHGKPDASGSADVVWAKFGVDIVDADGDRDSAMIQVDIRDAAPVAHDDCNEFSAKVVNQDFNIVIALDVSGSMRGDKLAL